MKRTNEEQEAEKEDGVCVKISGQRKEMKEHEISRKMEGDRTAINSRDPLL
jgi:hypothetical protein